MLNLKKGLALVLAAATALTFAPVSTLGLTGVVQAKAATNFDDSKITDQFPLTAESADSAATVKTWDGSKDAYATATAGLASTTGKWFFVKIQGPTDTQSPVTTKTTFTVSDTTGVITRDLTKDTAKTAGKLDNPIEIVGAANPTSKTLAFKANSVGQKVVTLTSSYGKTLTLTFNITGPASTKPKFTDANGKTLEGTQNLQKGVANTIKVQFDKTQEGVGNSIFIKESNSTTKLSLGSVGGAKTIDANGSYSMTFTPGTVGLTELQVYDKDPSSDDTAKLLATLSIDVEELPFTVTAKNLQRDKFGQFNFITDSTSDDVTVKITKKNDTSVSPKDYAADFDIYDATSKTDSSFSGNPVATAKTISKANINTNTPTYFWVRARKDKVENGDYTITLTQGTETATANFNVSDNPTSGDDTTPSGDVTPVTPETANASAVYGGVTTSLLATDNTTYSLVNSDAEFELNNQKYTAQQLKWYLTKNSNTTPENMGFTQGSATITESGTGKLNITVNNAKQFAEDVDPDGTANDAHIVGVYTSGAINRVIYDKAISVSAVKAVTRKYDAGTIATNRATINANDDFGKGFLDGVTLIGVNNKLLNGANSTVTEGVYNGTNFKADVKDAAATTDNSAKGSQLKKSVASITRDGVYYETYYVPYTDETPGDRANFIAEITVKVSVNAGPVVEVKEGDFTYSSEGRTPIDSKVIDLDLTTNKTFDIAAHTVSNKDNTTYSYWSDTQNVTVDAKGVVTAAKVGTAVVEITPKAGGVEGPHAFVFFRVNKNADDKISVTGKDGDKATVLTTRQFNGNSEKLSTEEGLAKAQVGYVQIEVTGDETSDVKEDLTVKGTGTLSYSLVKDADKNVASVDAKTGKITISHAYLNDHFKNVNDYTQPYVFPVKVVSTETDSSALTTSYFYVVVDYADAQITGLENSYEVGTSIYEPASLSWLNLGQKDIVDHKDVKVHVSSNGTITTSEITNQNDLNDSKLYDNDNSSVFSNIYGTDSVVKRAIVAGQTEHVLVKSADPAHKVGQTYRVVTIKSVAGQSNYVTKIENVETGKTVYEQGAGVNSGASIIINKPTVVKVTVAHAPSASLNAKDDPAFTLDNGTNDFNYNTNNEFVAATENPNTYEVTLFPSAEGTHIVKILPTVGRLSETDYSLIDRETFSLAVKYSTADSKTPAQVKGVKLGNKKGAKVVVKFTKDTTDKNIKYYVQKKVGKKTSGKSVGSNRTILSVKKGATVKVRVKAYYYDANGVKHVGKYSKWVTKKTDKK